MESVSIRTRHFCRVMHLADWVIIEYILVSIRTRHFCRVMRGPGVGGRAGGMFQSAPGISAG